MRVNLDDARALVVEFYKAIEYVRGRGSVEGARKAARAMGAKFRNEEAAKWLSAFTTDGNGTSPKPSHSLVIPRPETRPGDEKGTHARPNCIVPSTVVDKSTTPPRAAPQQIGFKHRPTREQVAIWKRRNAICELVRTRIETSMSGPLPTRKLFHGANGKAAEALADRSDAELVAAWEHFRARTTQTPQTVAALGWELDRMARTDSRPLEGVEAIRASAESTRQRIDAQKQTVGPFPPPLDMSPLRSWRPDG